MAGKPVVGVSYQAQLLTSVVGGTVKAIALDEQVASARGVLHGLIIRGADGVERTVWILADAEGNGPGWADVVRT